MLLLLACVLLRSRFALLLFEGTSRFSNHRWIRKTLLVPYCGEIHLLTSIDQPNLDYAHLSYPSKKNYTKFCAKTCLSMSINTEGSSMKILGNFFSKRGIAYSEKKATLIIILKVKNYFLLVDSYFVDIFGLGFKIKKFKLFFTIFFLL